MYERDSSKERRQMHHHRFVCPRIRTLLAWAGIGGAVLDGAVLEGAGLGGASLARAEGVARSPQAWWPEQLDLSQLRQHSAQSNPLGEDFDYASAFATLDLRSVKQDIRARLTSSEDWWPADYGNYGPFFIRMAWHSAGTYRVLDGRGGAGGAQQRFEPLNSWPDNANLDKARRLLWPIKQKYGRRLSWGDLLILTGNVSLEAMGFPTLGFAGGREDDWEADRVYWGREQKFLAAERYAEGRQLEKPLAAVQMGLIYVNPEGPEGKPDPKAAAADIRETFQRMAMNDEETVALIAGGHTFGKAHGAHDAKKCLGPEPAAAGIEHQGFGWQNRCGEGHGNDAVTSGLEGAWSVNPITWSMSYLENLMTFDWIQTRSPAGAVQWIPKGGQAANLVPDAHERGKRHPPVMFTTDIALKVDPAYRRIVQRFRVNPEAFRLGFAQAWFKLTHRDMGPRARYRGSEIPETTFVWQDPIPEVNHELVDDKDIAAIQSMIRGASIPPAAYIRAAWSAAASFRGSDMRGGANGARFRLAPQKDWAANSPRELARVVAALENIQQDFQGRQRGKKRVSLADLVILAGNTAVEDAARQAGFSVRVPFRPGRMDATQAQTDVTSFSYLEPKADGFRNYDALDEQQSPLLALIDRAQQLNLTVPEMTVLLGGLRVLDANTEGRALGVLTRRPGTLSPDFFVHLLEMSTRWVPTPDDDIFDGIDRKTGKRIWQATSVDLIFGAHPELRAVAETYAQADGHAPFVRDFVAAWTHVTELDRFDLPPRD